jgi:hypothetical protein
MEKIIEIERQLNVNIDLLEIAKAYCEFNNDKSDEISALIPILEIILDNQKNVRRSLDYIYN